MGRQGKMNSLLKVYLLLVSIFLTVYSHAQEKTSEEPVAQKPPIPVEVFAGHRAFSYQHIISRDVFNDKFNFFNISAFDAEYGSNPQNEFVISSFFSYKLSKRLSAGIIGQMIPKGSSIFIGAKYNLIKKDFFLVVFPSYRITKDQVFSQFMLMEYRPRINDKINAYLRTQLLLETDAEELTRGIQQFRLGLEIQQSQFGLAANFDQFAGDKSSTTNFGAFYRLLIF